MRRSLGEPSVYRGARVPSHRWRVRLSARAVPLGSAVAWGVGVLECALCEERRSKGHQEQRVRRQVAQSAKEQKEPWASMRCQGAREGGGGRGGARERKRKIRKRRTEAIDLV